MSLLNGFFLLLVVGEACGQAGKNVNWKYSLQEAWDPPCSTGEKQSPIAINTFELEYQKFDSLRYVNFQANVNGTLSNQGYHGVTWSVDDEEDYTRAKISGGGLQGDYFLSEIHFRWAASDCEGSDHLIDFKPKPLELQIITRRSTKVQEEKPMAQNVAIFSYMFDYAEEESKFFSPLFAGVSKVAKAGSNVIGFNVTLLNLLPGVADTPYFYRYNGSLPYPNCAENVIWTVFSQVQTLTKDQMAIFRKVQTLDGSGNFVTKNFREVQQLFKRSVQTNRESSGSGGGGKKRGNEGSQGARDGSGGAPGTNSRITSGNVFTAVVSALFFFAVAC